MTHMPYLRNKRLDFEQLEGRCLLSGWSAAASHARAVATNLPGVQASPPPGDGGQFEGRRTINYLGGSLDARQAQALSTLQVFQDQDFHFVLTAAQWNIPSQTGVQMIIRDSSGHTVFTMQAAAGVTRTVEAYLDAGTYAVQFARDSASSPSGLLLFELGGVTLPLADTTQAAAQRSTQSTLDGLSFFWLPPHTLPSEIIAEPRSASYFSFSLPPAGAADASQLRFVEYAVPEGGDMAELPAVPLAGAQAAIPGTAGYHPAAPRTADRQGAGPAPGLLREVGISPPISGVDDRPVTPDRPAAGDPPRSLAPPRATPKLDQGGPVGATSEARATSNASATAAVQMKSANPAENDAETKIVVTTVAESTGTARQGELWQRWVETARQSVMVACAIAPVSLALGWCAVRFRALRKQQGPLASQTGSIVSGIRPAHGQ
jgi:hypothetical protein